MALGTRRLSRSITLVIALFSLGAITPAAAPASTVARMSSLVILSFVFVGTPIRFMMKPEMPESIHTSGLKIRIRSCMSATIFTATFSGRLIATRFGIRSAKMTKRSVTSTKEQAKETLISTSSGKTYLSKSAKTPVKAASPTIPPKIATALIPI